MTHHRRNLITLFCLAIGLSAQDVKPVSKKTAEHYSWGDCCDGWYLAKTPNLHAIEERLPPGSGEKLHFHGKALQFFYVLEGNARFMLDGRPVAVGPREGLSIAPGIKHRVENSGKKDLVLLVISQPPSQGDRFNVEP